MADQGWQTVKSKADKAKGRPKSTTPSGSQTDLAKLAFAEVDKWQKPETSKVEAWLSSADGASTGGFTSLKPEPSPPPSPKTAEQETERARRSKPKKPKVKKPSVAQVATDLDVNELHGFLEETVRKYKGDEAAQLQTIADHFLKAFRECDLPFNRTVLEQPLDKATDVPCSHLPAETATVVTDFLRGQRNAGASSKTAATLADAVFEGVPEQGSKALPPKAKIGLLLFLSLLLRAKPNLVVPLSEHFLANAGSFSSARHLPFQLWIVNQAARSELAAVIAFWTRVFLPQVLGSELPGVPQKPTAVPSTSAIAPTGGPPRLKGEGLSTCLAYLEAAIKEAKGRGPKQGKGYNPGEQSAPLVAPGAVDAVLRAGYAEPPVVTPTPVRIRFLNLYEELRELYLIGFASGNVGVTDAVRLALDSAAAPEGGFEGEGSDVVAQASRNLLDFLKLKPQQTANAWESRHKQQLRGSARVLQHFWTANLAALKELLATSPSQEAVLGLLKSMQERHSGLLSAGKGWQHQAAQAAQVACEGIAARAASSRRRSALLLTLMASVIFVLSVLAVLVNIRKDLAQELAQRIYNLAAVRYVVERVNTALRPVVLHASGLLQACVDEANTALAPAVESARTHLAPYYKILSQLASGQLQKAQAGLSVLVHTLHAEVSPVLHTVSARVAALIHKPHSS